MKKILIAALLLGIAGCATAEKTSSAFDCVPAGYEDLNAWNMRDLRQWSAHRTESGQPVNIVTVVLSKGERVIVLVFIDNEVALLDPAPEDKGIPALVNSRYFNPENLIKSTPSGACEWRPLLTGETA